MELFIIEKSLIMPLGVINKGFVVKIKNLVIDY
jgi:hypothetical protein